jgi:hypothetical protein
MNKLPEGFVAAALALSLSACGGMMDRGGWGGDSASSRGSGSAAGSSAYPDETEPRGSFPQPPD